MSAECCQAQLSRRTACQSGGPSRDTALSSAAATVWAARCGRAPPPLTTREWRRRRLFLSGPLWLRERAQNRRQPVRGYSESPLGVGWRPGRAHSWTLRRRRAGACGRRPAAALAPSGRPSCSLRTVREAFNLFTSVVQLGVCPSGRAPSRFKAGGAARPADHRSRAPGRAGCGGGGREGRHAAPRAHPSQRRADEI